MKITSDFVPVILGSDENAYGSARLFYDNYGVKARLLCAKSIVFTDNSKILDRTVIKDFDTAPIFNETVKNTLIDIRHKGKRALLLPCSDYYAELTSKASVILSPYVENPLLSHDIYEMLDGKEAFYKLCNKYGLPYPETLVCLPTTVCGSESPFGYPVIIKPENSNSYEYLHSDIKNKKKVYLCSDKAEYENVIESFIEASYNKKIIVQRYIGGDETNMLTVNAYCGRDGKVRVIGAGRPLLCYRDPLSLGNYAAIRPAVNRDVCDSAASLLEAIGYKGVANFDLKRDPETGIYLFFEINPRAGRSSYFMKTAGHDLMTETVRDCIEDLPFIKRLYAERDGIWSDVPISVLKRYASEPLPKGTHPESAISLRYDASPIRTAKLIRAMLGKAKLFERYG